MRIASLLLLAFACRAEDGTPDGNGSPAGDDDDAALVPADAGLVWVDATGVVVDRVAEIGGELMWADPDGWWWRVVSYGSEFQPDIGVTSGIAADETCEELWYVGPIVILPPRVVLICSVDAFEGSLCAWDGGAPAEIVETGGYVNGGQCEPNEDLDELAIPAASIVALPERPQVPWAPPLHPEWR